MAACLYVALWSGHSGIAEEIYYFNDEQGVAHFSNVPADSRYRLILHSTAASRFDPTADLPAVILFAPPMVDRGSDFVVNVIFANFAAVQGWLEIQFDPAVLTLTSTSLEHDAHDAGRVRVKIRSGQSAPSSADLHFLAKGPASEPTVIKFTQTALKTGRGDPVVASLPPDALVAISPFK